MDYIDKYIEFENVAGCYFIGPIFNTVVYNIKYLNMYLSSLFSKALTQNIKPRSIDLIILIPCSETFSSPTLPTM